MKQLIVMTMFAFGALLFAPVNSLAAQYEEDSRTSGQSCNKDVDCAGKCMCINGKCGGSDTCKTALVVSGTGAKKDLGIAGGTVAGNASGGTKAPERDKPQGQSTGMRQKAAAGGPTGGGSGKRPATRNPVTGGTGGNMTGKYFVGPVGSNAACCRLCSDPQCVNYSGCKDEAICKDPKNLE